MGSRQRMGRVRSWYFGFAVSAAVLGVAGCGSGSPSPSSTTHPSSTTSRPSTPPTTTGATVPSSPASTAVLNAWESAQQTLYGYLQAPWQQDRANLVAGQTASTLWPNLANYFVDPGLKSEQTFLVGVKMGQLNGPTSFVLGTPKVSALTSTTAKVAGCIYDSGTTTATGQPGPSNLDGGGPGGYQGTWDLVLLSGSWKIASFKTSSVPKC
jgi:hypothetical protein